MFYQVANICSISTTKTLKNLQHSLRALLWFFWNWLWTSNYISPDAPTKIFFNMWNLHKFHKSLPVSKVIIVLFVDLRYSIQKWTVQNLWKTAFKTFEVIWLHFFKFFLHKFYLVHSWILLSFLLLTFSIFAKHFLDYLPTQVLWS